MSRITIDAEVLRDMLGEWEMAAARGDERIPGARKALGCVVPEGATVHDGSPRCLIGTRGCVTVHGDPPAAEPRSGVVRELGRIADALEGSSREACAHQVLYAAEDELKRVITDEERLAVLSRVGLR